MKKQSYELNPDDFRRYPVWVSADESEATDELTVHPADEGVNVDVDAQTVIVGADFVDAHGKTYCGYIYWFRPLLVGYLQPVMFVGDDFLNFWNGMAAPSAQYLETIRSLLGPSSFPLRFRSWAVSGLDALEGELAGIYFLDEDSKERVVSIGEK